MAPILTDRIAKTPGSELERQLQILTHGGADPLPHTQYKKLLRRVRLRPTNQRLALADLLFSHGNRHVTAEMLYQEAVNAKISLSLATVYNVLKQFTEAGLLRQIGVDGAKLFFDTNPSEHHHFFIPEKGALLDIPAAEAFVGKVPQAPEGFEVVRVSIVVRLRRKRR